MKREESLVFDFLRGGGALLVFIAHIQQIVINPTWMPFTLKGRDPVVPFLYSQLGALGVMIFFVLSGYLIACSIERNVAENRGRSFSAGRYFKARLNRLLPPLILSQIIVLGLYTLLHVTGAAEPEFFRIGTENYIARDRLVFNLRDYLGSMVFLNTLFFDLQSPSLNGPLWSVAQEFWFYVIAGFSMLALYKRRTIALPAAVVILLACQADKYFFYGLAVWLSGFAVGMLHMKRPDFFPKYKTAILVAASSTVLVWLTAIYFNESGHVRSKHQYIFGLFFCLLVFILINNERWLSALSRWTPVQKIAGMAGYSYTLYLLHFPLLLAVFVFTNKYTWSNLYAVGLLATASFFSILYVSRKAASVFEDREFFRHFFMACRSVRLGKPE